MSYVNLDITVSTKTKKINDGRGLYWAKHMYVDMHTVCIKMKK